MWCDYQAIDGTLTCLKCGDIAKRPTRRQCGKASERPPKIPPLHRRLKNFSTALIAHELAGSPTCTQEQVDARHSICIGCEIYLPDKDNPAIGHCCHETCGCPITQLGRYVSKLAWADQACPLGKWPAIESPTQ